MILTWLYSLLASFSPFESEVGCYTCRNQTADLKQLKQVPHFFWPTALYSFFFFTTFHNFNSYVYLLFNVCLQTVNLDDCNISNHLAENLICQFSSVAQLCPTLCDPMDGSTPGLPVHHQLLEFTHTHVHWVGDAIQTSHPLLSPYPPAFHLSQHQGLFQWVSSLQQVAKVLEFQLQHQSFQWIFRTDFLMDWLDLLAVQGTLKSLLQHHNSKTSILQHSAFFIVQLSHPCMTTGKNHSFD